MVDLIPLVTQYGTHAVYCPNEKGGRSSVGCAVASTASVMRRYGIAPPMAGGQVDLGELGASMAKRHREREPASKHGSCPNQWCAFCSYLELKARSIPVAYGRLTWDQIVAHARRGEPVVLPLRYGTIPIVPATSYSTSVAARGRSDRSYEGGHMVTLHGVRGETGLIADPDFGSPARPRIPLHTELPLATLEQAWIDFGRARVTYATQAPPGAPAIGANGNGTNGNRTNGGAAGVSFQFGGAPSHRGRYRVRLPIGEHANLRSSPHVQSGNVIRKLDPGTTFACAQTTLAGTNVQGSARWHGTRDGKHWLHSSVVAAVGPRDGREDIR